MQQHGLRVALTSLTDDGRKVWQGHVVRAEGRIDAKTRNTVVVAKLSGDELIADDGFSRITIGQFVRAEIEGRDFDRVVELPRVALHNGDSVYIVDKESRLRERKVTIVDADDDSILVADGLSEGEIITTSPLTSGVEGVQVVSTAMTGAES